MEHFYESIPGWFTFADVYKVAVEEAPRRAHFVEVGAFMGRSSAFMAVEIANSGKQIKFDVVDSFDTETMAVGMGALGLEVDPDLSFKSRFLKNIDPVKHLINVLDMPSLEAAKRYRNRSLDFVYIDGDHAYEAVKADILAWSRKIREGGVLAGHDYSSDWPGVVQAVSEVFGKQVKVLGDTWHTRKNRKRELFATWLRR
jgi:hypothetical protein